MNQQRDDRQLAPRMLTATPRRGGGHEERARSATWHVTSQHGGLGQRRELNVHLKQRLIMAMTWSTTHTHSHHKELTPLHTSCTLQHSASTRGPELQSPLAKLDFHTLIPGSP